MISVSLLPSPYFSLVLTLLAVLIVNAEVQEFSFPTDLSWSSPLVMAAMPYSDNLGNDYHLVEISMENTTLRCYYIYDHEGCDIQCRGTVSDSQLFHETVSLLTSPKVSSRLGGTVQQYFQNGGVQVMQRIWPEVSALKYFNLYGHSLGGALASVIAGEILVLKPEAIVGLYTFGMPRTGDAVYARALESRLSLDWRFVNQHDLVAHLPSCHRISNGGCRDQPDDNYHHGLEIWYTGGYFCSDGDAPASTQYMLCKNEDPNCSNSVVPIVNVARGIHDHRFYFGLSNPVRDLWDTLLQEDNLSGRHCIICNQDC